MSSLDSIFGSYSRQAFPYLFSGRLRVELLAGGTPSNPDVAEAWIRSRGAKGEIKDALLMKAVQEVIRERNLDEDAAVAEVAKNRHLTGFKRDPERGLYIEGRQLKACIKEAASVAADENRLKPRGLGKNNTRKGIISFMAEHVFVPERRLYLETADGEFVTEPTDVPQSFVHTFRGSGIQYTEIVEDAEFDFTVETDHEFTDGEWAQLWLTAERQGIGAGRSQGNGRFKVIKWDAIPAPRKPRRGAAAAANGNGGGHDDDDARQIAPPLARITDDDSEA